MTTTTTPPAATPPSAPARRRTDDDARRVDAVVRAFDALGVDGAFARVRADLAGADRLGLEPTYWGDSLTPRLLDKLAAAAEPDDKAVLAPTLYGGHAAYQMTPRLAAKRVVVQCHGDVRLIFERSIDRADDAGSAGQADIE